MDGWRVDVANMTGRRGEDEFTHDVARLLRRAVHDAGPDGLIVAEHAHDATSDLDRDGWHGTMNYAGFTRPVWTWLRSDDLALADFLGVPGGVPRLGGVDAVAAMRAFAALQSWQSLINSWNMLGSHDTARIWTVIGDQGRLEVAIGLLMTMPGVPMIFAGDELGLSGVNGEDARRTMPWHRPQSWNNATLETFRRLAALRRSLDALRHGGLQWAHVGDDAIAFVRESDLQRVLVFARRSSGSPIHLDGLDARECENVYGGSAARYDAAERMLLPADGPTLQLWRLA